jgi:hypothetical protein
VLKRGLLWILWVDRGFIFPGLGLFPAAFRNLPTALVGRFRSAGDSPLSPMDYYLGSGSKKRRLTDTEDAHEEQGTKQEDKARSMRTALAQKDWFLRYPAPQKAITTQISTGNNACESPTPPITPQKASKLVVKRTGDYAVELGLFNNMPDEIAVLVLAQLPELKYFSALHSVCKRFAELTDDKLLWKVRQTLFYLPVLCDTPS